jgi:acetoin:2,6-dichlorophenolindophenol oxidoreductase subunit beta
MSTPELQTSTAVAVSELTMAQAIRSALRDELAADERVIVLGEDVGHHGGIFGVTEGLLDEFGRDRLIDTPISELGVAAAAVGAAVGGLRPVLEIMFNDFMTLSIDQLVNEAAKMRYMTGGQLKVPLTVRTTCGTARSAAAHHSQSLYAWLCHVPGLKVVFPSTAQDSYSLTRAAIADDSTVVLFEDKSLYATKGAVDTTVTVPIGEARLHREGRDVTVIATGRYVRAALELAAELPDVDLEVVEPRTLAPLDVRTLVESVRKTRRAVVVDGGVRSFGITAEIAATLYAEAFDQLDAPIERVGGREVVIPFSPPLEAASIPAAADIRAAVERVARA